MRQQRTARALPGWDRLRHGGLMLDSARLATVAQWVPADLDEYMETLLRQRANAMLSPDSDVSPFVSFVLERVCGIDASAGDWSRGNNVAASARRRTLTGESVKPNHLWEGPRGATLPVFLDGGKRLGIGRSRRIVSQALGWLRAGNEHLALVTNGRQWRLLFAGLDYDAWCEWNIDLWFEEGRLSSQVTALRTLLRTELWTPEADDAASPLLQAIRDTRKGQAELSEVLGERVREAVEILIQGHGGALLTLIDAPATDTASTPEDIYRAACRVAMRLVVILFAESRDLLPRDNTLYHESYGFERASRTSGARRRPRPHSSGELRRLAPGVGAVPARPGRLPSSGPTGVGLWWRTVRSRDTRKRSSCEWPCPGTRGVRKRLFLRRRAAGPRCPQYA